MSAVITVVFEPAGRASREFDHLLDELGATIRADPPEGMESMKIMRTEGTAVIVQAQWRSPEQQQAFRSSPVGSRIFRAMSDCCLGPPVTWVASVDPALSFPPGD